MKITKEDEKLLKAWDKLSKRLSKGASKVSDEEREFFLWGFDLGDFELPKSADEFDRKIAAKMVESIRVYRIIGGLSSQQKEVLAELVENPACTDGDIALRIGMKTKGVSAKITKLFKKFSCNSRAELVAKCLNHPPTHAEIAAFILASSLDRQATQKAKKAKFAFHSV